MGDFHVEHALDQLVDIGLLLNGVFVIHVIQIHMHNAFRRDFLYLIQGSGEFANIRVAGDQHARNAGQIAGIRQAILKGKRQLVAMFFRNGE